MTLLALLVLETSYGRSLLPPTSVVIQDLDGRPMDDPKAGLKNRTLGCPEYEIIGLRHRMTHRDVENKLPLLDEMVHTLMSRDTDSRIIPREEEAVRAWLASDKIFHIMRDHPAHCLFGYIMGCRFGILINLFYVMWCCCSDFFFNEKKKVAGELKSTRIVQESVRRRPRCF
ncbi:hypothetical protein OUZ56_012420 [Daphnia magna]|uniref:Uncharacterized protein n=1 Tax=Daphnia magna TaxID=35525 RepID=A0ABQ9Z2Y8_9CRUS|nr:hypothetical protein OUZ56_012420 [Daphnia magna]